ncbi:MAG: ATP-grasp domain-containing protein [Candidatus Saccharimonadales bacterium]
MNTKPKGFITYDHTIPIGVIHSDSLAVIPFIRYFDDVVVVTDRQYQWLKDLRLASKTCSLDFEDGVEHTWYDMVLSDEFAAQMPRFSNRDFILYAPLAPPYRMNPLGFIMNSPTIAHAYENKRYFREEFVELIRMPAFEIATHQSLQRKNEYERLRKKFTKFVVQDEESVGCRATFIIENQEDFLEAVAALKESSSDRAAVVSEFIPGVVASTQVCITKYGTFNTGVQRQLVNSKHLCNPELEGTAKWCGGELGGNYPEIVNLQVQQIAHIVGSELASRGYKGIFGIDIIVTPENKVYAIEINARMTGYSQLISDMQAKQGKIPFLLLHALEVGNVPYKIEDLRALPASHHYKRPLSFLVMSNPLDCGFTMKHYIRPGIYRLSGGELVFEKATCSIEYLHDEESVLIICKYNQNDIVPRGAPMLKIMHYGSTIGAKDLTLAAQRFVKALKKQFELP